MPTSTESLYTGVRGLQYHASFAIPSNAIPWVARGRAKKIAPHVSAQDTVLEYGVGYGWNLSELKCARRLGFDIADHVEPHIRAMGIEFVRETSEIQNNSVDVVICHHTLEHILGPSEAILEMRRMLCPSGKLLLFVPFEKERRYRQFSRGEKNHHLYSWNVQTLGNLIEQTGFVVTDARVGRFGYDRFAAVWAARLRLGEIGFRLLRFSLHLAQPGDEVRVISVKS